MTDRFELRLQDYSLSEDQDSVRDAFGEFFAKECPSSVVRAAEPLGFDQALWSKLLGMGVTSMSLPAAQGGDDATLVDLVLITEELGRTVAPVPFISHVVCTRLLAAAGADTEILQSAVEGQTLVALAFDQVTDAAARQLVPDAAIAGDVISFERAPDDGGSPELLVLNRAGQPRPQVANQGSTPLAWWDAGTAGDRIVLAEGATARKLHDRAVAEWKLLTAAALVGMTDAALQLAVDFAKTRQTMGVPIGSLQGVSFPLADIAMGTSGARNLIWRAAWLAEHEPDERPELVAMAFAYAARIATHGTTTAAHLQGGLGFTSEADASLYFLRAKGWSVLGGDPNLDLISVGDSLLANVVS
ncbi:acyl-CoA dehydrogenase family protein [Jatrophihabitans sp. DSM 45814]